MSDAAGTTILKLFAGVPVLVGDLHARLGQAPWPGDEVALSPPLGGG